MFQFTNLKELFKTFHNEDICREYLEKMRWADGVVCPYCNHSGKMYRIEKGKRHKCGNRQCHKKFSVTVGTVYENTKVPLSTWFGALYLFTAHKKGISSLQLHRDLGVTQKTAWFMLHRLRETFQSNFKLTNIVEADETYIGGKEKNKHAKKRVVEGRVNIKTPVLGIIERHGRVYARKLQSTSEVLPIIQAKVKPEATIMTDSWNAYQKLGLTYHHMVVDHTSGEYVEGMAHTNTIEGFWSILKRGVVGIYHFVSYKHLNHYCDEFSYRYNTRYLSDPQRFHRSVPLIEGKRLKYKDLTSKTYQES